jgi:hypothetical protein
MISEFPPPDVIEKQPVFKKYIKLTFFFHFAISLAIFYLSDYSIMDLSVITFLSLFPPSFVFLFHYQFSSKRIFNFHNQFIKTKTNKKKNHTD